MSRAGAKAAVTLTLATAALWCLSTLGVFDADGGAVEPAGWQDRQVFRVLRTLSLMPHYFSDALPSTRMRKVSISTAVLVE